MDIRSGNSRQSYYWNYVEWGCSVCSKTGWWDLLSSNIQSMIKGYVVVNINTESNQRKNNVHPPWQWEAIGSNTWIGKPRVTIWACCEMATCNKLYISCSELLFPHKVKPTSAFLHSKIPDNKSNIYDTLRKKENILWQDICSTKTYNIPYTRFASPWNL